MANSVHRYIIILLLFFTYLTPKCLIGQTVQMTDLFDDNYDRYKKRGDAFFKTGNYLDALRQYQNCLEVPGFENNAAAQEQLSRCKKCLGLRLQANRVKGDESNWTNFLSQLYKENPDDPTPNIELRRHYEDKGSRLFDEENYRDAIKIHEKALNYAATREDSTILSELILKSNNRLLAAQRAKLRIAAGAVGVGTVAIAWLLRNDYQSKLNTLRQISQSADPTGSGIIDRADTYHQYADAYAAARAAQQKNGLFRVCVGVAAVATLAELYLLVVKPKPRKRTLGWQPSSESIGLAVRYTF